jgi:hypothetical protein
MPMIWTLGLLLLAHAATGTAASAEKDGLRLAFSAAQTPVAAGQPVIVTYSWTNLRRHGLRIEAWRGPTLGVGSWGDGADALLDFAVYTEAGERLEYRGGSLCGVGIPAVRIGPGDTLTRTFDITDAYDLRTPGRYVLRTVYWSRLSGTSRRTWRGMLLPPDITLEIREQQ